MKLIQTAALAATLAVAPFAAPLGAAEVDKQAVLKTYADIAHAGYEDSLITAKALQDAVEKHGIPTRVQTAMSFSGPVRWAGMPTPGTAQPGSPLGRAGSVPTYCSRR